MTQDSPPSFLKTETLVQNVLQIRLLNQNLDFDPEIQKLLPLKSLRDSPAETKVE